MESMEVVALIPCRDGQETIEKTILSILNQTVRTSISVADDSSVDDTPKILERFTKTGRVRFVRYPKREPKNYARVPVLLNMALSISPQADFYLISGDDCTYPTNYCENLISMMKCDGVDICSGYIGKYSDNLEPSGSGRLISYDLMKLITPFPLSIGWETWILYKTLYLERKIAVYPIKIDHQRRYSLKSTWSFGQSAYVNGVPLLFTILRSVKNIFNMEMSILNSLSMVFGHIEYLLRGVKRLDTAPFVKEIKLQEIRRTIKQQFLHLALKSF